MIRDSMSVLCLGLLAVFTIGPIRAVRAVDKQDWQQTQLKKLHGRWTTNREEKLDEGKILRKRLELEFADGKLTVFILDEKDAQIWSSPPLTVIGAEKAGDRGLASRLNFEGKEQVYYDFVGDRLIVVGRIGHRPFEGFTLSGEFMLKRNTKKDKPNS